MGKILRYVMRDCDLFADREDLIGQVEEITIPVPEVKTEEMRNAGMIKAREVHMGYEKSEMSFKMPNMTPQTLKLFGLKPGATREFMATAALGDEDGTVHSAVCFMRGFMKKVDMGSLKPGEMGGVSYEVAVHEYNFEIDEEPIFKVSDYDIEIGGVSQYGDIRRALLTG